MASKKFQSGSLTSLSWSKYVNFNICMGNLDKKIRMPKEFGVSRAILCTKLSICSCCWCVRSDYVWNTAYYVSIIICVWRFQWVWDGPFVWSTHSFKMLSLFGTTVFDGVSLSWLYIRIEWYFWVNFVVGHAIEITTTSHILKSFSQGLFCSW